MSFKSLSSNELPTPVCILHSLVDSSIPSEADPFTLMTTLLLDDEKAFLLSGANTMSKLNSRIEVHELVGERAAKNVTLHRNSINKL